MLELSAKATALKSTLERFMRENVIPNESRIHAAIAELAPRWETPPIVETLKSAARAEGLWNLFLPGDHYGAGLSNYDYAPLCEIMGRSPVAPELFNCSAPDTGNMETLVLYGTEAQKERWLKPLLEGTIRSCFSMSEPDVASSDATNIRTEIRRDGDSYVVNGRKWWSSGAMSPRCRIAIVMGCTDPAAPKHKRQSMILVPIDTPGVKVEQTSFRLRL